jgi:hypothetical protein
MNDMMVDDMTKVQGLLKVERVDKTINTIIAAPKPSHELPTSLRQQSGSTTSYSKFLLSQRDVPAVSPLSSTIMRPTPPTSSARQRRPRPSSSIQDWAEHALAERLLSNLDLEPVKDIPFKPPRDFADDDDISPYSVPIANQSYKPNRPVASSAGDHMGRICAWEEECNYLF